MTILKTHITVAILFISSLVAGQDMDRRSNLEAGVRAGVNFSNVWDERGQEFTADTKAGGVVGVFVGIPIGQILGVQPEILLSQKGFKGSGSLLGSQYSFTRTTTYLDIPLQVQIKPIQFVTIVAGPQFSYLLQQKNEYTFGSNSTEQNQEFNNDNARKNILGFTGGLDLIYQNFLLSGRVGWDMQTNNGDGTSLTPRYKNQWLQFTVGVKL
jgi:hypothetical protein